MTIREYDPISDEIIPVSQDVTYLVSCPTTNTVDIEITMKERVYGELTAGEYNVTFGDNDPDTITREVGSWHDDDFDVGMVLTVSSSVSNDGTYTVAAVTDKTLTLDGGDALTNETIDAETVTITGRVADADWFLHEQVSADSHTFTYIESGPTGIRFTATSGSASRGWVRS